MAADLLTLARFADLGPLPDAQRDMIRAAIAELTELREACNAAAKERDAMYAAIINKIGEQVDEIRGDEHERWITSILAEVDHEVMRQFKRGAYSVGLATDENGGLGA